MFLPAALRAGWAVRAFLRTPAKVADVDGLEKVKGDLTDAAQIAEFVRGADAVACLAGVPRGAKPGGPLDGFMLQAIKDIVGGMSLRFSSCTRQVLRMCLQPDRELRASAKQVFCYLKGGIKLPQPVLRVPEEENK